MLRPASVCPLGAGRSGRGVVAGGEDYGKGGNAEYQHEGEEEVGEVHLDGEGVDNEISVAHLDDAELLLEETADKSQSDAYDDAYGGNEQSFDGEGPAYGGGRHSHGFEYVDVALLVDDEQRERGDEAEGGDEYDEGEDEDDGETLGAENLEVERLLFVAVFYGYFAGGRAEFFDLLFEGFLVFRSGIDCEGGAFVGGIFHEGADQVDVGENVFFVNFLLYLEDSGGMGGGTVEGVVEGKAEAAGAMGDMNHHGAVAEGLDAEGVGYLAAEKRIINLVFAEDRFSEEDQTVQMGGMEVFLIYAAELYDGLVLVVGDPGVFFHYGVSGFYAVEGLDFLVGNGGEGNGLSTGGLHYQGRVEYVEERLSEGSDSVIDGEYHDKRHGAYRDTDERDPGDDVYDGLSATGKEVSSCYEKFGLHFAVIASAGGRFSRPGQWTRQDRIRGWG